MLYADPEVAQALRIAAVPATHPYVQNLVDPEPSQSADAVLLLPDPVPAGGAPGQWWPPVMLDAEWIAANADSFDLLHLHFGTESFSLAHLREVVDALQAARRPLVFTVHDLTNPQLTDQCAHLAQLDLLIGEASEIITLTAGAAREVRTRWGREATVIAHPRMVPEGAKDAAPDARGEQHAVTIGVHLRDLRPNIDALTAVDTLLSAVAVLRESGLDLAVVVELNDRVRDEATRTELRTRLAGVAFAVLNEHPRFTDAELHASLERTDISVMPYGHGTHSGWLELCWDLGVAVAAPALGFYAEQHPVPGEVATYERGSAESLAGALLELLEPLEALDERSGTRAAARVALRHERAAARAQQQQSIHLAHLGVYRRALAGMRG